MYRNNANLLLVSKHKLRGISLDVIVPLLRSHYSEDRREDVVPDGQSMRQQVLLLLLHGGARLGGDDGHHRRYRHRRHCRHRHRACDQHSGQEQLSHMNED